MAHGVMSTNTIFNWANILSTNLLRALEKAIQNQDPKGIPFYFTGYLLDVLCASNPFPGLKWAWTLKCPPIHLYCKRLCRENNYKEMYTICDHFITLTHKKKNWDRNAQDFRGGSRIHSLNQKLVFIETFYLHLACRYQSFPKSIAKTCSR